MFLHIPQKNSLMSLVGVPQTLRLTASIVLASFVQIWVGRLCPCHGGVHPRSPVQASHHWRLRREVASASFGESVGRYLGSPNFAKFSYVGDIWGIYWDNGKENGNCYLENPNLRSSGVGKSSILLRFCFSAASLYSLAYLRLPI